MSARSKCCEHRTLQLGPSSHADDVGFQLTGADRRLAAATQSGRNPLLAKGRSKQTCEEMAQDAVGKLSGAFPGPLVLPDDDLAWDPKHPPQSFRSWLQEKERNKPSKRRNIIYVAAVPSITSEVEYMSSWTQPIPPGKSPGHVNGDSLKSPDAKDFVEYLGAFYHGMAVKPFPERLRFTTWDGEGKKDKEQKYVGLATKTGCTRIRARSPPDGVFKAQLNLEDLLDAAIDMLPDDAYSIVLLFDHDLYEDEDDDYCCGRAYGGSRVCVVQTARYHPDLDQHANIDHAHMWPASHCKPYVDQLCRAGGTSPSSDGTGATGSPASWPIRAAIDAAQGVKPSSTIAYRRGLWFSRLARTVAHELGHCFGMDHCIYYACMMQGTAGMAEDVRQPPYLCAVCVTKVSHAVAEELERRDDVGKASYAVERYEAMASFCDKWQHVGMFAGYGAWARGRIRELS